jgi:hypothetical protein
MSHVPQSILDIAKPYKFMLSLFKLFWYQLSTSQFYCCFIHGDKQPCRFFYMQTCLCPSCSFARRTQWSLIIKWIEIHPEVLQVTNDSFVSDLKDFYWYFLFCEHINLSLFSPPLCIYIWMHRLSCWYVFFWDGLAAPSPFICDQK